MFVRTEEPLEHGTPGRLQMFITKLGGSLLVQVAVLHTYHTEYANLLQAHCTGKQFANKDYSSPGPNRQ